MEREVIIAKGKTSTAANLKADVVVIGGGGAGMAAAITAKEKGVKDVILLEKRKITGGNSAYMEGIFAAESPAQQRMGIEALCDDIFKQAMDTALCHQMFPGFRQHGWRHKG